MGAIVDLLWHKFKPIQFQIIKVESKKKNPTHRHLCSYSAVGWILQFHCLWVAGMLSRFSSLSSNNRSAGLCTAADTDGQFEQPAGGKQNGHPAARQQHSLYCSLTNHCWFWNLIMVTKLTADLWEVLGWLLACIEKKRAFCFLDSCYESPDHSCFQVVAIGKLCCGISLEFEHASRFLLNRIRK